MTQNQTAFLGFWSMVMLGLNGMIGSGIFLLPGKVMSLAGNWSPVVYLIVTFIVLAISWCFAQCASLFTRNGGAYIYAKEAFGEFIGFEIGLMRWVIGILGWASIIVGFITALSSIWPEAVEEPIRSLLIIGITGSLGLLNIRGVQIFKYLNNFVTLAKLIPLLLFVFMGIFYVQREHFTPLNWHELEFESFGAAALVIFYAFGGFETLVVVAEEMKNPQKNLPLAVMVVIAFCSLLYLLIQFIAIGVLGKDLAHSITPLADAAQLFLGETGKLLITIIMLISIGGVNLACSFITPRSGVVLAEDGFIPQWISTKGRFGSPVWAIIVTIVFTALFSFSGSFGQLIVVSVVSRFAQYISTCIAVYVLHRRLAIQKKTHLKSTYIIIPSIALIGVGWLLLQASMYQLVLGLGALLIGIPIYWIQKYAEKESKVLPDPIPSLNVEKSNLSPLNDF